MITCTITSSQQTKRYEDIQKITLPAFLGEAQVLQGHAEAFLMLQKGNVILQRPNEQKEIVPIASGECHVKDDDVIIVL